MADKLTKEQRYKCMKSIKSKDSQIEVSLRHALWAKGYRYRKNYNKLPGKPDIVLPKYRIAVFCDSEFFHGKDWESSLREQIQRGSNSEFWVRKIGRNMERDREVNQLLKDAGWTVIRLWGKDIKKNLPGCIAIIEEQIRKTAHVDDNPC